MEDELYHYGVKGMKWGVRKDRSSMAKSVARDVLSSLKDDAKNDAKRAKEDAKYRIRARHRNKKLQRDRSRMSDEELDAAIERLRKEDQLDSLVKKRHDQGKEAAKEVLTNSAKKVATLTATAIGVYAVNLAIQKVAQEMDLELPGLSDVVVKIPKK